ncbi:hypothetical protein [Paraburkholderia saeva]|uniref:hypothetical protein n=1 Tax=Paraburkholderia saeva TaxID=2777537 RepID=UPI001DDE9F14|nr:hypothetical protein [Paraburkholderia saeva]CAG4911625.1 hypothetical protein R52603_03945 [Paraburkholderia saeva]
MATIRKPPAEPAAKRTTSAPSAKQSNVTIEARKDETDKQAKARIVVSPTFNAAIVERRIVGGLVSGVEFSVTDIHSALVEKFGPVTQNNDMSSVEMMLLAQAHTCDLLFNDLVLKARASDTMPKLEAYMRIALKAQQQSASALRTLGELKSPKQIAFIKQANVAHQQQVNNGTAPPVRAHEENGNQSNELLEHQHGERMDTGTASAAGRGNQTLETVGAVNRTHDG